jgi:hypothetical protein
VGRPAATGLDLLGSMGLRSVVALGLGSDIRERQRWGCVGDKMWVCSRTWSLVPVFVWSGGCFWLSHLSVLGSLCIVILVWVLVRVLCGVVNSVAYSFCACWCAWSLC